jgi:hypothetical protein
MPVSAQAWAPHRVEVFFNMSSSFSCMIYK